MSTRFKRVSVIGGPDARTHAMVCHLIDNSPGVEEIFCAPGSAGIAQERLKNGKLVTCVPIEVGNIRGHLALAKEKRLGMTLVGPERPLVRGVRNLFAASGQRLFGCDKISAQFEGSKYFAQDFANKHGVRFAPGESFTDKRKARAYARRLKGRCAVKADGLRNGKGVEICRSLRKAYAAIDAEFKMPRAKIVIQELLKGREVTLMLFCDGKSVKLCETARDYKRALDGDIGPQTGGVGAYSSDPLLSAEELAEIQRTIIGPWLEGCEAEGIVFKGILYIGLMVTKDGIFALEFNVRLGDPEAQVLLPRLENDLLEIADACLLGTLDRVTLRFKSIHTICVVMSTAGYPKNPESGQVISGLNMVASRPHFKVFHYGTRRKGDLVLTPSGRSLAVTGWSEKSLDAAANNVYGAIDRYLEFSGGFYRRDIGEEVWRKL
ncbi:MAG: phosphoribosylamine--glycine ligase [bacterium]|nr:phosphoribosylamine--glycine ligase [bacterium]